MIEIQSTGTDKTLTIDGKPFLMLAGEVHNSTGSSIAWMERAWDKAETLGMNTLLVAVAWEDVEPDEGCYDFSGVDALIDQARERGGHLGLLWFGSWKNGQCMYAPSWVKSDTARFWRAEPVKGQKKTVLTNFHNLAYTTMSAFCDATREADAKAFAALMAHVRDYDAAQQTVIAVQVENECGMMGAARDHVDAADAAFAEDVPAELIAFMREHADGLAPDVAEAFAAGAGAGSWEEVFGPVAEELFQTWYTARYVEFVAAAGKAVYPLPLFVNTWLDKGHEPGRFPTGGPNVRVFEIWKLAAPSIDVLGADIYPRTFCDVCDSYRKLGNPLLIPETATHAHAAPRLAWTVGHHHALCFSPFGFEEMGEPFSDDIGVLFGMDTSDPAQRMPQDPVAYRATAEALAGLFELGGGYGHMDAVIEERGQMQELSLGSWKLAVRFADTPGAVVALPVAEDEAYVLLMGGAMVQPQSASDALPFCDLLLCEEGTVVDGAWVRDRRLNGDETTVITADAPTLLRMRVLCYA